MDFGFRLFLVFSNFNDIHFSTWKLRLIIIQLYFEIVLLFSSSRRCILSLTDCIFWPFRRLKDAETKNTELMISLSHKEEALTKANYKVGTKAAGTNEQKKKFFSNMFMATTFASQTDEHYVCKINRLLWYYFGIRFFTLLFWYWISFIIIFVCL